MPHLKLHPVDCSWMDLGDYLGTFFGWGDCSHVFAPNAGDIFSRILHHSSEHHFDWTLRQSGDLYMLEHFDPHTCQCQL